MTPQILLVENDNVLGAGLQQKLTQLGYEVLPLLTSGKEAIIQTKDNPPDLILIDILLEGDIDGIEVVEQLHVFCDIPVVYLADHVENQLLDRAKITQPAGFLIKPVSTEGLKSTIEMALYRHKMEKKIQQLNERLEKEVIQRQRTEEFCENEKKFKALVETSFDGIIVTINGLIVEVNQACAAIFNYSVQELLGKSPYELLLRESALSIQYNQDENSLKHYEIKGIKKNATLVNLEITEKNFIYKKKKARVIGIKDISQSKKDEDALKKAYEALELRIALRVEELNKANQELRNEIEKRRTVENELQHSLEFAKTILDSMNDSICIIDVNDFTIFEANAKFLEKSGLKENEVLGKTCYAISHHSDKPCSENGELCPLLSTLTTKENVVVEHRHFVSGNEERFCEIRTSPIFNRQGEVKHVIHIDRDITDKMNNEKLLRESEERFRTVADFTYNWEFWVDTNCRLVYVSPSCQRITGYTPEEFMQDPSMMEKIVHSDDYALLAAHFEDELIPDNPKIFDFKILTKNGEERWIRHSCQPVFGSDGSFRGRRASNQDVTKQKKIEAALRESRELYHAIVEDQTELICRFLPDGQLTFVNQAYCRYFETKRLENRPSDYFSVFFTEDGSVLNSAISSTLSPKNPVVIVEESVGIQKEEVSWILWTVRAFYNSENQLIEYQGVGHDITEKKRAEIELLKYKNHLEERVEEEAQRNRDKDHLMFQQARYAQMGEMLSMIAHQWRQPLNAISTASIQLAIKDTLGELDSNLVKEVTDFIGLNTQKMSGIITDFMEFFRPVKEKEFFSLAKTIEEIRKIMGAQLSVKNISLINSINPELQIKGYSNELEQALINFITNARDAYEEHPQNDQVILAWTEEEQNNIILYIEDKAGGIPPAIMDRIFDPYFTTKEQGKGTGIGLYLSKNIIENRFRGKVSAESVTNGTRFLLILPKESL